MTLGKPTLRNGCIGVDAAVAEEGPIAAHVVHDFGIALGNEDLFVGGGGLGDDAAKGIGDKGVAPEFEAAFGSAFVARAVDGGDIDTVRDGVGTLHGAPSV